MTRPPHDMDRDSSDSPPGYKDSYVDLDGYDSEEDDEEEATAGPRRCIVERLQGYSDRQFKRHLGIDRASFVRLARLIMRDDVFKNTDNEQQEVPLAQLAVALSRLDSFGNCVAPLRFGLMWDRSVRTCLTYIEHTVEALLGLQDRYLAWPTPVQRRAHAARMAEKKFPGCVGFVAGTTISLPLRPACQGRERARNVQVVCDMDGRILMIFLGSSGVMSYATLHSGKIRTSTFPKESTCLRIRPILSLRPACRHSEQVRFLWIRPALIHAWPVHTW
ncbi:unnamed protein product [Mortierella alpina]